MEEEAGGSGGPFCGVALPLPPSLPPRARSGRSWVSLVYRWLGFGQAEPRETGSGDQDRRLKPGVPGGRGKPKDPLGRGHAPQPQKDQEAHSPRALRGSAARALTLTRATFWLPDRVEPVGGWFSPGGNGGGGKGSSVTATSPRSGNRGQADALRVAGALRGRAVCGQLEAAVAACGLFPPIHKSSAGHRWRAGLNRERGNGGRGLCRTRRQQENKRARSREPGSCVRGRDLRRAGCRAAGAAAGRGGAQTGRPARRRAWRAGLL